MATTQRREELDARAGVDLKRLARRSGGSLAYTVLMLVAVVLVLGISMNLRHRWDLTVGQRNVLSAQTLQVLSALDDDVTIYPLFSKDYQGRRSYWFLLKQFRDASERVSVEFIDPVAQPGMLNRLGLDVEGGSRDGSTVVVRGQARRVFNGIEEEDVTNAILDVGLTERRVVGFIRGYGEKDPASDRSGGMSLAAQTLVREYYELVDVELSKGIPPEVTVLVAAGARMPIPVAELDTLAKWLEEGGRLLVLADPGEDAGLGPILDRWSLEVTGDRILEPRQNVGGDPDFLLVANYTDHEVVEGFGRNLPCALPVASSVRHFESGDPLVLHQGLAATTRAAVAVSEDGRRSEGPFRVAAASWRRGESGSVERETRVVLIGDSDFVTNVYLPMRANQNLFLNCMGWLSREQSLISIRKQPLEGQLLEFRPVDRLLIPLIIWGVPLLVVFVGLVVYVRRRGL